MYPLMDEFVVPIIAQGCWCCPYFSTFAACHRIRLRFIYFCAVVVIASCLCRQYKQRNDVDSYLVGDSPIRVLHSRLFLIPYSCSYFSTLSSQFPLLLLS